MKKVAVVMGSDSDLPVLGPCLETLKNLNIPFEAHVYSAHRCPQETAEFARSAAQKGFGVLIGAAGRAAHLAGALAAHSVLPVIGIPVRSGAMAGLDALLSTAQMPEGIPVATVAIDGARNAALLAAQILAVEDGEIRQKLLTMREDMRKSVLEKNGKLEGYEG
ncbi:MAG: 5-(carboxyamino)imidazole ribonucleotide mutase [Candidatus Limiplasma sp.]|nr:5-(carboxyamino)imidazole ribonucleotide mutase [Candidatus Limiplasma sp.]